MYRFYERLLTICIITALCLSLFQIGHILVLKNALWISVQNIRFDKNEYLIFKGDTIHLTAVAEPLNATNKKITLHSTKDSVAIVNQKGIVTAIRVGTCEIIAEAQDGSGSNAICSIIVKDAIKKKISVSELVINKLDKEEFCKGDSISLSVKVSPENATDKLVEYRSTDENVAKVNADGKVNMQGEGECRIIEEAAPRLVEVHVPNPKPVKVTSIVFDKSNISMSVGDRTQIHAKVLPTNATNKTLEWLSSNRGVATVNNGKIVGVGEGECTIRATSTDGNKVPSSPCKVFVKLPIAEDLPYGKWKGNYLNGKPNGKGSIEFNKTVLVTDGIYAQKGYTLKNAMFVNGKLISGTLYDTEGEVVRVIVSDIKL